MFTPGTILKRTVVWHLRLFQCLEPLDVGARIYGEFTHPGKVWIVIGAYHNNPPVGLCYYYVLGEDGTHGWSNSLYALSTLEDITQ